MRDGPCAAVWSHHPFIYRMTNLPGPADGVIDAAREPALPSHRLTMGERMTAIPDLLPGTLDLLILRLLVGGSMHGYGLAQRLKLLSNDVLQVGESSLYPALQRLLLNGFVDADWGPSENNRRARYYSLTRAGRKHMAAERREFESIVDAIRRVLETA
jgi:transcriptional regulator